MFRENIANIYCIDQHKIRFVKKENQSVIFCQEFMHAL